MPVTANGNIKDGQQAADLIAKKAIEKGSLTKQEIEFILSKLRNSEYKGHEFERFYVIWVKLNSMLEKLK
jgi:hypothetical protein